MEKLILRRVDRNNEEMILNFGPQHPSTHGVINFIVETDGEVMKKAIPDVGYLHRSIEKIGEGTGYPGFMPFTDRVDYVAAMFPNEGYGIEVPRRAQYLRAISCELARIASHLVSLGTMTMDIGAFTPMLHGIRERETINDLIEALCGARLTYNYHRIGGVAYDLPEGWKEKTLAFLDHFDRFLVEFDRLISFNEIYIRRLANVAVISAADAVDYGLVGPNLRGSGVDWDLRRDMPYGAYEDFEFSVPVGVGFKGTVGDCYDRYYCRVLEMGQSSKIVRQALLQLPAALPRAVRQRQVAQAQAHRGAVLATLREAVTDKMLGGRHHAAIFEAFTLQTLNVSHPKVADEQRVFAESLFHPPPAGIAGHIQDRGQALVGADRPQLTSDLGGHPLGQLGPPGGGQAEHLRVNRAAQSHISGAALLVDDGWDAQAGFFDQISLESIVETGNGGRFKGGITRRTSNLADAVGQELPGLSSRKIRARLNLVRPSRIQLGQFFIQGHLGEKSFNAGSDGEGSVTVRH